MGLGSGERLHTCGYFMKPLVTCSLPFSKMYFSRQLKRGCINLYSNILTTWMYVVLMEYNLSASTPNNFDQVKKCSDISHILSKGKEEPGEVSSRSLRKSH
jgi:hypothetical protein